MDFTSLIPSPRERRLVARCLRDKAVWIGAEDEIWAASHSLPYAREALGTLRECVEATTQLAGIRMAVNPSNIQAYVLQLDDVVGSPYCLMELSEYLCEDREARDYWQSMLNDDRFPHRCPRCGASAFIGFLQIECRAQCLPGR